VVPGGGVAYPALPAGAREAGRSQDEQRGVDHRPAAALEEPLRQIVANGYGRTVDRGGQGARRRGPYGFNAATDVYEDLLAAGVLDPTKVSRHALQNAASVAGLMLTT